MDNDSGLLMDLLSQMESSALDFKEKQYRLESDLQKSEFVKDILCMANAPRDRSAYIVVGVIDNNGRAGQVIGTSAQPDPAVFQDIVNGKTDKPVHFSYREISYLGVTIGLFEIPLEGNQVPIMARRRFGNLRSSVIYSRRNAQNCEAEADEIKRIVLWSEKNHSNEIAFDSPEYSWESFLRACDHFDSARIYVAVLGQGTTLDPDDALAFSRVGWQLLVDFDQSTDEQGMYTDVSPYLSEAKSLRLTALDDPIGIVSRTSCIWVAAMGLSSRPSTIRSHTRREWNQIVAPSLVETLGKIAQVTEPYPVTAVILSGEVTYINIVCNLLDQAFKSRLTFVVANEHPTAFAELAEQFEATTVPISLPAICRGLRAVQPASDGVERVELPNYGGGITVIPPERARWLEEELELVHANIGLDITYSETELQDFLKGHLISWHALNLGVDVARTSSPRLQQRVSEALETRTTRRLNLWHWPGAGGTTVSRRIAWNLHTQFPTVLAKRMVPEAMTERLRFLFETTRMPVLMLVEESIASHNELDGLYDRLRSSNIPAVLLTVGRRDTASAQPGSFYIDGMLDNAEASAFAGKLAAEVPDRRVPLERLSAERISQRRTPFYFGLVAFGKDFIGLEPYVSHRLADATVAGLSLAKICSLLYHYGQKSTPAQLLTSILAIPRSQTVAISTLMSNLLQELFLQEHDRSIRPAHELIARQILEETLSRGYGDRRNWPAGVAQCAIETMETCATHYDHTGGATADLVRSVIIERGTQETPTGLLEGQFSNLIEEIPSSDGQKRVLERLTELFPGEAHFWAHLGRFYTRRTRDHSAALACHTKALQLDPQDPVLYHMTGMALRGELDELLESPRELDMGIAEDRIQSLAQQALNHFEESQRLDPRREHSYISAIELIAKVVHLVGRLKGYDETTSDFLVAPAEVWYRELLDKAETLMADLVLVRAGEEPSGYVQRAEASLSRAYGDLSRAIEGWTNLLDRPDVYHPPLRRNIINAYLTRQNRDWGRLSPRELERVVGLAQQNLEEQPNVDQNLRIWFRAVRMLGELPLGHIAERLTYKRLMHPTVDTLYYLYIIKVLQADSGGVQAAIEARETIEECGRLAASLPRRTHSFEWLGTGAGIQALVHERALGSWDPSLEFWSNVQRLRLVEGRISSIRGPAAGEIELVSGLKAFFVPSRGRAPGGYLRGRDEARRVRFFLGFSYDGLRAWSVEDPDVV